MALSLALALAACSAAAPPAPRYVFPVAPGTTYDLGQGRPLTPAELSDRLRGVRLLFLGEQHTSSRSHAFQREVIAQLAAAGRRVTVALEMLPPAADAALDAWREGRLEELAFLEQADWYEAWGFPWAYYRDIFLLIRERRMAVRGVNADRATRTAAREGKLESLPAPLRAEIGDLDDAPEPHARLLLDVLNRGGHGRSLAPEAPEFRAYHRVQTLWDRLMGGRAAGLAAADDDPQAIVVVLIGSGHLAYKLGANLYAARAAGVAQLSLWDDTVGQGELDAQGRYAVPLGVGDLARVYLDDPGWRGYPAPRGLGLGADPGGVKVTRVPAAHAGALGALKPGDVIQRVAGERVATLAALRLAFERLPWERPVELTLLREGRPLTLTLRLNPAGG
ncbi:MAG: ChaN family lipoprotein [Candidatus Lambdaproteobacteria bacterium]|nr:ChaN family lipoprotein [Candidatus Lambdaproteobacteria bacterium]